MITFKKEGQLFRDPGDFKLRAMTKRIRDEVVHHIRDYTRDRIRYRGQGAGGSALKGYSTNPLVVDHPGTLKPKRKPVGGMPIHGKDGVDGMYFHGGYKEYRDKAGLPSERFMFFNLGNAWRDWQVLVYGETVSQVGFGDGANAIAANAAEENGRELMFKMANDELALVNHKVMDVVERLFFT